MLSKSNIKSWKYFRPPPKPAAISLVQSVSCGKCAQVCLSSWQTHFHKPNLSSQDPKIPFQAQGLFWTVFKSLQQHLRVPYAHIRKEHDKHLVYWRNYIKRWDFLVSLWRQREKKGLDAVKSDLTLMLLFFSTFTNDKSVLFLKEIHIKFKIYIKILPPCLGSAESTDIKKKPHLFIYCLGIKVSLFGAKMASQTWIWH